jgi:hypothetical protein
MSLLTAISKQRLSISVAPKSAALLSKQGMPSIGSPHIKKRMQGQQMGKQMPLTLR